MTQNKSNHEHEGSGKVAGSTRRKTDGRNDRKKRKMTGKPVMTLVESTSAAATLAEPEMWTEDKMAYRIVKDEKGATCVQMTSTCMKRFLQYVLSYLGLTCMVAAYSIVGGFIFVELEKDNEEEVQAKAVGLRNNYTRQLEKKLKETCMSEVANFRQNASCTFDLSGYIGEVLREFQKETYVLVSEKGWSGVDEELGGENKWTFAGALLFSVTVITTIGISGILHLSEV